MVDQLLRKRQPLLSSSSPNIFAPRLNFLNKNFFSFRNFKVNSPEKKNYTSRQKTLSFFLSRTDRGSALFTIAEKIMGRPGYVIFGWQKAAGVRLACRHASNANRTSATAHDTHHVQRKCRQSRDFTLILGSPKQSPKIARICLRTSLPVSNLLLQVQYNIGRGTALNARTCWRYTYADIENMFARLIHGAREHVYESMPGARTRLRNLHVDRENMRSDRGIFRKIRYFSRYLFF